MLDIIFGDITGACNLRCPFCSNDWRAIKPAPAMEASQYRRYLEAVPSRANEYSLSCQFEPSLYPDYAGALRAIPKQGHAFLTTNLARRLEADEINALTTSNLKRIQVSIESLIASRYIAFRAGASHEDFTANLGGLARAAQGKPVELRAVILAFKSNWYEIPILVERLRTSYGFRSFDIRTPFAFSLAHISADFAKDELLSEHDFATLMDNVQGGGVTRQEGATYQPEPGRFAWVNSAGQVTFPPDAAPEYTAELQELQRLLKPEAEQA